MAWLQKRPQVSNPVNFYTTGLNKAVLLVGLGNPGHEYDGTRHNIGFAALDTFITSSSEMSDWIQKKDLKCLFSSGQLGESRVIAIKPTTYMNLSGQAVQATLKFYKLSLEQVAVIHDELDIDFGQLRMRIGGSSAGHNGIESISNILGENYGRIRIGIGPKSPAKIKSEDFVLKRFSPAEQLQLPNLLKETSAVISELIYGGELPHETRNFLI